jgi:hypothetical protein
MSAIYLDKKLRFRLAIFGAGAVITFVLLEVSGVQRVNSWIILFGWLLALSGICFFSRRRTR